MKKKLKNKSGFTLVELLVAVGIFAVIAVSSAQIFQMVLKSQRYTIYAQNVQENVRFSVEAMGKEIRNALIDRTGDCVGIPGLIYSAYGDPQKGSDLFFINQYGECVRYYHEDNRLKIARTPLDEDSGLFEETDKRETFITPSSIDFLEPVFLINNGADQDVQNRVTMVLRFLVDREAGYKEVVNAQTTVSSRYYPVRVAEPEEPEPEESPVYASCNYLASATWLTNCSGGPVNAGEHDTVKSINNTASGYSGSADFKCNDGAWELQPGSTCTASEPPVYASCNYLASAIWLTNCSGGPVYAGAHGTSQDINNDNTTEATGSIRYTCNNGTWQTSNASCSLLASCSARTLYWSNCEAYFSPTAASGVSYYRSNTIEYYTGYATFTCNNGSWVDGPNSCSPNSCVRHDATAERLSLPCVYWTKERTAGISDYYKDSSCSQKIDPFNNEDAYCGCATGYCYADLSFYFCTPEGGSFPCIE